MNLFGRFYRFCAPEHRYLPRPDELLDPVLPEQALQGVDLRGPARDLEDHALRTHVHDLGTEDVRYLHHLGPTGPGLGRHLDERELPVHRFHLGDVRDLDHVDQFVQLLDDLLHLGVVADDDDGDPAHVRLLAGTDGEALDVEPPAGEEARDPGEDPRPVQHEDREGVGLHRGCPPIISLMAAPAGTMGKTFSSRSIRKSMTKGPSVAIAVFKASLTSSTDSTRIPSTP